MKDEPNDIDREAALVFAPVPGMRVIADFDWVRVATDDYGLHENHGCATDAHSSCGVGAIDTDDPATMGCMLAQIHEHAALWYWPPTDWRPVGAWAVVGPPDDPGCWCRGFDPVLVQHATRGAALVSAKRAVDKNRPARVPDVSALDTQRRKSAPQ